MQIEQKDVDAVIKAVLFAGVLFIGWWFSVEVYPAIKAYRELESWQKHHTILSNERHEDTKRRLSTVERQIHLLRAE